MITPERAVILKEKERKRRWGKAASRWGAESAPLTSEGSPGPLSNSAAAALASIATQILTLGVKGTTPMASLWQSKGIS